jgi:hypothetical protein
LDIAKGEQVEGELNILIERRHDKRAKDEGERATEEAWAESARRHVERQRQERRAEWCEYHRAAAERARRTLEALIADHEAAVAKLEMLEADTKGDAA